MAATFDPLEGLLRALRAGDYAELEELFAPDVRFRASLPDEVIDARNAAAVAASYQDWFGDASEIHVLASGRDRVGDVTTFHYRMRVRGGDKWFVIQQAGALETNGAAITSMRLACTGFQADTSA